MTDSDIQWGTILKDSLKIIILGIIYLIICINCIVLVKFFPHYRSKNNLDEKKKKVDNIFKNETILDAIFPTDLQIPPYNSYADAQQFTDIKDAKHSIIPSQTFSDMRALENNTVSKIREEDSHIDPLTPGDCGYQESEKKWANQVHEFIYGLHNKLKLNDRKQWPYNWLEKYDSDKNTSWNVWYFKYKIANILTNQRWFSRSLMKALLSQEWWGLIPDWVLFLSIPLGSNLVGSLMPILPAIIGFWLTWVVGIVLIIVTIMTYFWVFLPPSLHKFDCNMSVEEEVKKESPDKIDFQHIMKKLTTGCSPNILGQFCMFMLMAFSAWLFSVTVRWWRNGINIHPSGMFGWLETIIKDLGDFALIIAILITFAIFMSSGGFLIIFGAASMTMVWLVTLFKLFIPTFLYPAGILNVFYCNKEIITILLTAMVTLNIQQNNLLPTSVTGTMWGVWGILVLKKILLSSKSIFTHLRKKPS